MVKYDAKKAAARQLKWQRIADEAAKQCARTIIPRVEPITELKSWLQSLAAQKSGDTAFVMCYENEQQQEIKAYLQAAAARRYVVLIGPEGGFSQEEGERLRSLPFTTAVSLGPRILRADTAAISALTLWQAAQGDWRSLEVS